VIRDLFHIPLYSFLVLSIGLPVGHAAIGLYRYVVV